MDVTPSRCCSLCGTQVSDKWVRDFCRRCYAKEYARKRYRGRASDVKLRLWNK